MYTIYKSITVEEFFSMKKIVQEISELAKNVETKHGYKLPNDEKSDSSLALSYGKKEDKFHYNIGFNFDDNKTKTFHTYLLKAYDTETKRYYKRERLHENVGLDFLIENWPSIFEKSIEIINSWKKEELTEEVTFSR